MTTLLTEMATVMTQGFLEKHMNGTRLEVVIHHQTIVFVVVTVQCERMPRHIRDVFRHLR